MNATAREKSFTRLPLSRRSETKTDCRAATSRARNVIFLGPFMPETFETGGIVGIAEITDCVRRHLSKWFHGPFGWVLVNAKRLAFKRCKGQLKFFSPHI
jgi:hypothetical protein